MINPTFYRFSLLTFVTILAGCGGKGDGGDLSQKNSPPAPKIVPVDKIYDFGTTKMGIDEEHVWTIRNEGKSDLKIENVEAECSSTAFVLSEKVIPPGGEGRIKARVETASTVGPIRKLVSVFSNDPETPRLGLVIKGQVEIDIKFDPGKMDFEKVNKGESKEMPFSLEVLDPKAVKVTRVEAVESLFAVEPRGEMVDGKQNFVLKFKGTDNVGQYRTVVVAKYTGSKITEAVFPAFVQVVNDLEHKHSVHFYRDASIEFQPATLEIKSRTGRPFKLSNLRDDRGLLKLKLVEENGAYKILAEIADHSRNFSKPRKGKIKVDTTDPDTPEITIRYRAWQAKRSN